MAERTTNEFITLLRQNSGISAVKAYYESEAARLTSESFASEAPNVPVKLYTSNEDGTYTVTDIDPVTYSSLHYANESAGKIRNVETPTVVAGQQFISTQYDPRAASVFLNGSLLMPNDIDYTSTVNSITLVEPIEENNGQVDEIQIITGTILPATSDKKPVYVASLSEMLNTDPAGVSTLIWTDNNRGGIFVYDSSLIATNNGGTIFNGWVRQYSGAINVKWFGAKGDGVTDDTTAIQNTIVIGLSIYFPDGNYKVIDTLTIENADIKITLSKGAVVTLDTLTTTKFCFNVSGANCVIEGGTLTTTLRTLDFLVNISGKNSKIQNSILSFATKSTIAPIGGTDIPYNRGGLSLRGVGTEALNCEFYNQEGAGIVSYGTQHRIDECKIHDNVLGIHASVQSGESTERTISITNNDIYDNNVNHASGASGILTSYLTNATITSNKITGSGEHGTYIYSAKSTISNNFVSGNYINGLKVRASKKTTIANNIVQDNNTNGLVNGELVVQMQLIPEQDPDSGEISITGNICSGTTGIGIYTAWIDSSVVCKDMIVSNNVCNKMWLAFTEGVVVSGNTVLEELQVGTAFATAPATQSKALITGNKASSISIGRCINSIFSNNYMETLTDGTISNAENIIISNVMSNQLLGINRTRFSKFKNNTIECSSITGSTLIQASNIADNSFKVISGNTFNNHTSRVMDDSTSGISGNKNIISHNIFNSATEGISIWGDGHSVMGNINIGTGGVGYVGMNDSWLIGNSPIVSLRAGTTGNVVL